MSITILKYIYISSSLIGFALLIITLITISKRRNNIVWNHFFYFILFFFTIETFLHLSKLFHFSNNFLFPIFIGGEFYFASMFVSQIAGVKKKYKKILILISAILSISSIWLWIQTGDPITNIGKSISHIGIICLSAYSLVKLISEISQENIFSVYKNIMLSFLCYYTVSIFLFSILNQLLSRNYINFYMLWTINNLFLILFYIVSIKNIKSLNK